MEKIKIIKKKCGVCFCSPSKLAHGCSEQWGDAVPVPGLGGLWELWSMWRDSMAIWRGRSARLSQLFSLSTIFQGWGWSCLGSSRWDQPPAKNQLVTQMITLSRRIAQLSPVRIPNPKKSWNLVKCLFLKLLHFEIVCHIPMWWITRIYRCHKFSRLFFCILEFELLL